MRKLTENFFDKHKSTRNEIENQQGKSVKFWLKLAMTCANMDERYLKHNADPSVNDEMSVEIPKFIEDVKKCFRHSKAFSDKFELSVYVGHKDSHLWEISNDYSSLVDYVNNNVIGTSDIFYEFEMQFLFKTSTVDMAYLQFTNAFMKFMHCVSKRAMEFPLFHDITKPILEHISFQLAGGAPYRPMSDSQNMFNKCVYNICYPNKTIPQTNAVKGYPPMKWNGFKRLSKNCKLGKYGQCWRPGEVLYADAITNELTKESEGNVPIGIYIGTCDYHSDMSQYGVSKKDKVHMFVSINFMCPMNPEQGSVQPTLLAYGPKRCAYGKYSATHGYDFTDAQYRWIDENKETDYHYGIVPNNVTIECYDKTFFPLFWTTYRYHTLGTKSGDWFVPDEIDYNKGQFFDSVFMKVRENLGIHNDFSEGDVRLWTNMGHGNAYADAHLLSKGGTTTFRKDECKASALAMLGVIEEFNDDYATD